MLKNKRNTQRHLTHTMRAPALTHAKRKLADATENDDELQNLSLSFLPRLLDSPLSAVLSTSPIILRTSPQRTVLSARHISIFRSFTLSTARRKIAVQPPPLPLRRPEQHRQRASERAAQSRQAQPCTPAESTATTYTTTTRGTTGTERRTDDGERSWMCGTQTMPRCSQKCSLVVIVRCAAAISKKSWKGTQTRTIAKKRKEKKKNRWSFSARGLNRNGKLCEWMERGIRERGRDGGAELVRRAFGMPTCKHPSSCPAVVRAAKTIR